MQLRQSVQDGNAHAQMFPGICNTAVQSGVGGYVTKKPSWQKLSPYPDKQRFLEL
jgi:hypothetical protein